MTTKHIIGSVSHGTMREEDLIPRFMAALEQLNPDKAKQFRDNPDNAAIWAWLDEASDEDTMPEDASYFLNDELFDALNNEAPPYFYFGSHPGDGADYGFWLSEDVQQLVEDNGGLVVNDTAQVPEDFTGEVLHVNDHGNCTLYTKDEGSSELREVWSVV